MHGYRGNQAGLIRVPARWWGVPHRRLTTGAGAVHTRGSHPWVSIGDLDGTEEVVKTKRTITDHALLNRRMRLIPRGSLLLSFKLTIGKVAFAGCDLHTNEAIVALTPRPGRVRPRYLFHVLPQIDFESYSQPTPKGRTLNSRILKNVMVPVPSDDQQQRIIEALDRKRAEAQQLSQQAVAIESDTAATAARVARGDFSVLSTDSTQPAIK